ncbi:hypothetical protein PROFUN_16730 [Planoprotostelium fungivorum]|uniref:Uncharacterized protein n=1 Tax=Planoprotostelium fungivorum TaxID=1890364 RepID=A0A2P6MPK5_9EUKA|nr:hypothetical protein PROFUN_16730 [Planoprotostelium fungivorum]
MMRAATARLSQEPKEADFPFVGGGPRVGCWPSGNKVLFRSCCLSQSLQVGDHVELTSQLNGLDVPDLTFKLWKDNPRKNGSTELGGSISMISRPLITPSTLWLVRIIVVRQLKSCKGKRGALLPGLEPGTFRLTAERATDCAIRASDLAMSSKGVFGEGNTVQCCIEGS